MSTMVERVARAIKEADCVAYLIDHPGSTSELVEMAQDKMHHQYDAMARAAIEAMREPSRCMLAGAYGYINSTPDREPLQPAPMFSAMIDAALNEQEQGR